MMEHISNTTYGMRNTSSDVHEMKNTDSAEMRMARIIITSSIIGFGTIGNLLIFIVMQRGSLKHSSTCFYMAILALVDTGKCGFIHIMNAFSSR